MNASIIEACSCPMFCQCYFNDKPAGHGEHAGHSHGDGGEHFCKFNNAFKVNHGSYGETKLDGAKFWVAGDLGGDFSKGQMDWATVTFDSSVTPAQRDGIKAILGHVYPVKWNSFNVANDAKMTWTATRDHAEAKLDDGKTGEVVLNKFKGMTDEPIVIKNLKYWGVPRNDGFRYDAKRSRSVSRRRQSVRVQRHERIHDHVRHQLERTLPPPKKRLRCKIATNL